MERLKVFKVKRALATFLTVFGSILLIVGIVLVINSLSDNSDLDWNVIAFTLQGILFILLGYLNLRSEKYFIEWDDNQLNYLLPNSSKVATISFSEIRSITIKLFEIHLELEESNKIINLDNLQFQHIKALKQKFEQIKAATENGS